MHQPIAIKYQRLPPFLMDFEIAVSVYDKLSKNFDQFESNDYLIPVRKESLKTLISTFRQGKIVIDIGCGTGTEAIALAKKGVSVVGIDPAKGMIEQARKKAKQANLKNVQFHVLHARDLYKLPELCGIHKFQGAYSSLGSLNHEQYLGPINEAFKELLEPKSPVVISVMSRYCACEMAYFLFKAPGLLFRRKGPFTTVPIGGEECWIRMYSKKDMKRSFKQFKLQKIKALGLFVPPMHLGKHLEGDMLQDFADMDRKWCGVWPLRRLGDYTLYKFEKK